MIFDRCAELAIRLCVKSTSIHWRVCGIIEAGLKLRGGKEVQNEQ
jgi:hypothetical protein